MQLLRVPEAQQPSLTVFAAGEAVRRCRYQKLHQVVGLRLVASLRGGCQWSEFGGTNDLRSLGEGGSEGEFGPKSLVIIAKNTNFLALVAPTPQREGTLENSGEMLGWELRELRLRVTKDKDFKKFTDAK